MVTTETNQASGMRIALLLFLLITTAQAEATTYCVSTGVILESALDLAAANGLDDEIRIVTGTHTSNVHAPQTPQWDMVLASSDEDNNLTISGGWSSADSCNSPVSQNPADTVLDAQFFGPVLNVNMLLVSGSGNFTLRNLTLTRGKSFTTNFASGLELRSTVTGAGSVNLDNLLITSGISTFGSVNALDVLITGSGSFRLRNSIIRSHSHTGTTSGVVKIQATDSVVAYVSNNSIFDNNSSRIDAGLYISGIATVSNNAVADNTSTLTPSYQFFSDAASSLTLRNNHFATRGYSGTPFFAETNTTTGSAMWTVSGVVIIPDIGSPLRDSGLNSPTGGALSVDFRGNPRIVNTTMDRGAIEAAAPPPLGPLVTANTPAAGSTTWLTGDIPGGPVAGNVTFNVSGGTASGTTQINCQVTSGTLQIGGNSNQTVAVGQAAEPVLIGFDSTATQQTGVLLCQFVRVGSGTTFAAYTFKAGPDSLFKNGFE